MTGNAAHPALAMPLGGIGTGTVAIHSDGSLRQWQLVNVGNHRGYVPNGFFAVRVARPDPPGHVTRLLQARPTEPDDPAPLVTDGEVPAGLHGLLDAFAPVAGTSFTSTYPFAHVGIEDPELPVAIELEAFNPLVPTDTDASSLPVALFTVTITNPGPSPVSGWLAGAAQNAVGWDGVTSVEGNRCALYGGNVNRVRHRCDGWTQVVMDNPALPDGHPGQGQLVLATDGPGAVAFPRWREPADLAVFLLGRTFPTSWDPAPPLGLGADPQRTAMAVPHGPSPAGETWNAALATPFLVEPGETLRVRYLLAWHFPHRYVNFDLAGPARDRGENRFWLGNAYARRFTDAVDVAEHVAVTWTELESASRAWTDTLTDATLPAGMADRMAAQAVVLRSPTCFRAADGRFYGFEGVRGASTGMWSGEFGGSCALNCTHVWNYAQGPARLFPELERSMRDTELDHVLSPDGVLPHRVVAPLWLPQLHDVVIGGPSTPAIDGMLGTVLKTYRELRAGAGREWAVAHWPKVRTLLRRIADGWDADGDGVLRGRQPVTHDIDLYGANTFVGSLWLAALLAAERLAEVAGDRDTARWCRDRFEHGSPAYDELLWTGEYYRQVLDPDDPVEYGYGEGCLADQLIGQWWANQLDLGPVLPVAHVRTALRAILRHNLRRDFRDFRHGFRVYADGADAGLLVCSWPHGGRPEVPVRYADEVWTGTEWSVAALCLQEGLTDEGTAVLTALWDRYDGTRRNPFNEIECGDHYVRSMAGWSVLEATTGYRYDAEAGSLRFDPPAGDGDWAVPFVAATGWGRAVRDGDRFTLRCRFGRVDVARLALPRSFDGPVTVTGAGPAATGTRPGELTWPHPVTLYAGDALTVFRDQDRPAGRTTHPERIM